MSNTYSIVLSSESIWNKSINIHKHKFWYALLLARFLGNESLVFFLDFGIVLETLILWSCVCAEFFWKEVLWPKNWEKCVENRIFWIYSKILSLNFPNLVYIEIISCGIPEQISYLEKSGFLTNKIAKFSFQLYL